MIFVFAWRNLWRNTRRTIITLTAISLNAAILIATYSLMDGIMAHTISNVTNMVVGEAQIHMPKYLVDRSLYKSLDHPGDIISELNQRNILAAPRSYGYGLAAHETKSAGALFWGVDPKKERMVFDLAHHTNKGQFLANTPKKGIVLGKKLARSLNVDVGSEIVVVVQAADGSLGNELFSVAGILKAVGDSIDRNSAIIHYKDFTDLFVSSGRIHEIAVNSKGKLRLEELRDVASKASPSAEVKTWRQLMPSFSDMVNNFDVAVAIFGFIFFLAAALGVMNTMLMATFERIREFGILKAIGATPWRIVRDVTAEALLLSGVSTVIGIIIGVAGAYYLQMVGIDTSVFAADNYTIAGVAFDPVWRAKISAKVVVIPVVVMWFVCFFASLYPASIAARLDPVKAINHV